jgi:membrane carboxypeptidase/penicillin-binding protein PbpC
MQKKWIIGITALSLAAATAVGSTLAFFTAKTQTMTNDFTVAAQDGLSGQLREPAWDGFIFGSATEPDGSQVNPDATDQDSLGISQAKTILPGDVIQKDPNLMNTTNWDFAKNALKDGTKSVPVYLAMKVTYDEATGAAVADGTLTLNFSDKWTKIGSGSDYVVYLWTGTAKGTTAAAVESGKTAEPLFTTVTVNADAAALNNFKITVTGGEIQAKNLDTSVEANEKTVETKLSGLLA